MTAVRAYIGIGSNLADPLAQVRQAFRDLDAIPQSRGVARSPLYRSKPLGPQDQPDYINAAAALETTLSADDLLRALQAIEAAHGRIRQQRWGPRTLDLDLLLYGDLVRQDPDLTLPHPRLHERAFVLRPLYAIAPGLVIPGRGAVRRLLHACSQAGIEPVGADLKPAAMNSLNDQLANLR